MSVMGLQLGGLSREQLLGYLCRQLDNFFPDQQAGEREVLDRHLDAALGRLAVCIESVRAWRPGHFDYLHTSQYSTFLYFIANTVWAQEGPLPLCTKLFALNKALNGIDLFYEIRMPQVFLIGHSVGIVLAKAVYGEFLVLLQNSTVGKNHDRAPVLGMGTILFPNSAVIGGCTVGPRTTISQGCALIDQDTPGDCLVFRQDGPRALIKGTDRDYLEYYFRGM